MSPPVMARASWSGKSVGGAREGWDSEFGEDGGVVLVVCGGAVVGELAEEIFTLAETIRDTERRQAERIRAGASLRSQVQFRAYLAKRSDVQPATRSGGRGGSDLAVPSIRNPLPTWCVLATRQGGGPCRLTCWYFCPASSLII
jgi:hypothetical protein